MFENTDWKMMTFFLSLFTTVIVILGNVVNYYVTTKIKDNHLAHVDIDLKEIIKGQEKFAKETGESINKIKEDMVSVKTDVAFLKGQNANNIK